MQKARDNLAAIEIVKRVKEDGRPATRAEQAALAKYVGWGGLAGAFKNNQGKYGSGFEEVGKRLEQLLTPAEHATAAKSTQYAHYTAEHVIRSMWDAVARMGFKGGNVFEPGMGIGHFLGMMPPDIAERSHYSGIEMDHLTADVAKLLYPQSGVRQGDFTETVIPEGEFDLVHGTIEISLEENMMKPVFREPPAIDLEDAVVNVLDSLSSSAPRNGTWEIDVVSNGGSALGAGTVSATSIAFLGLNVAVSDAGSKTLTLRIKDVFDRTLMGGEFLVQTNVEKKPLSVPIKVFLGGPRTPTVPQIGPRKP
jgi:hypothetical protein